ncbi:hypothetical protein [Paenibacillus radicis (ex Xue et al. 2023)]|uniref:Uncharacterized protein n=1 Tax=Paenibacillus radicis (ex Xue et al. 2023) TaxID=2972489 RepID=A0ABT1YJW9_9BACL|nr:hypothetical protein [Paenibacillus radicis (ex Xue et al. 2023)]MCR8633471.1 hypothetical protein [Paenibacillus radicis (ex Xue et al. 2023)]
MGVTRIASSPGEQDELNKIMQLTFFDEVTEEDIRKTIWLLNRYTDMIDVIKNYEIAQKEMENGLSAYELLSAESSIAKRSSTEELYANIPANAVIMKDQRHTNYKFYVVLTNIIKGVVNNVRDPHEGLIAKLLFLEGMKYLKAQAYLEKGYKKDIHPIQATTFAEKRRRVIRNISNSLKINKTLDFVIIDFGRGRSKEGELGLKLPTLHHI